MGHFTINVHQFDIVSAVAPSVLVGLAVAAVVICYRKAINY